MDRFRIEEARDDFPGLSDSEIAVELADRDIPGNEYYDEGRTWTKEDAAAAEAAYAAWEASVL